jgi:MoxR-like ATPase
MRDVKSALVETKKALGKITAPSTATLEYMHGDGVHRVDGSALKSLSVGSYVWISYKNVGKSVVLTGAIPITPENTVSIDLKLKTPTDANLLIRQITDTVDALCLSPDNALRLQGSEKSLTEWVVEGEIGSVYHLMLRQPALAAMRFVDDFSCRLLSNHVNVGFVIDFDASAQAYVVEEPAAEEETLTTETEKELEWVGTHWIQPSVRPLFKAIRAHMESGQHFNLLLAGASGFGKTTTCRALADYLGYSFLRIDCSKVTDTEAWFGYQEARDGSTVFEPTAFTKLLTEGKAVILLDEANRIEPWIANSLFPVLDDDRATEIHNIPIKVAPSVVFVLTVNLGTKYAGTHVIDAAFRNRVDAFDTLVAPPKAVQQKIVAKRYPSLKSAAIHEAVVAVSELTEIADREGIETDLTTRTCLKLAKLLSVGMPIRLALEYVVVQSVDTENRKPFIDKINVKWGTLEGTK